jgi:hypothetical protein
MVTNIALAVAAFWAALASLCERFQLVPMTAVQGTTASFSAAVATAHVNHPTKNAVDRKAYGWVLPRGRH